MRLKRFIFAVVVFTVFSLIYVYQQTEIFLLAYAVEKKSSLLQDLVDKNTLLRYNISRGSSITHIGRKISEDLSFPNPQTYQLIELKQEVPKRRQLVKKESFWGNIFKVKNEAQAKTINP